jgi:hypothetical protein
LSGLPIVTSAAFKFLQLLFAAALTVVLAGRRAWVLCQGEILDCSAIFGGSKSSRETIRREAAGSEPGRLPAFF